MKEKKQKKYKKIKAGAFFGLGMLAVWFVVYIILTANIAPVFEPEIDEERKMRAIQVIYPALAEGDELTGNESGFVKIWFVNVSGGGAENINTNTSGTIDAWARANMPGKTPYDGNDSFYLEVASETTFVVVVKARFNKTHCWSTNHFDGNRTDVQMTATCTSWAVGADSDFNNLSGSRYETYNNTGEWYIYEHFIWDNDGVGYQIADDATLTISEIYIEAEF